MCIRDSKLTVTAASVPSAAAVNSGSEVAFLKLDLPKRRVHAGEVIAGQLQLYLLSLIHIFGAGRLWLPLVE